MGESKQEGVEMKLVYNDGTGKEMVIKTKFYDLRRRTVLLSYKLNELNYFITIIFVLQYLMNLNTLLLQVYMYCNIVL